jgi:glycosyltransferase involved in cell wall biosynthesis
MNPILSILIPTYNRKDVLAQTLNSLVKQIRESQLEKDVEIYIGDNCSPDGTEAYLKSLCGANDSFIKFRRNTENLGAVRNLLGLVDLSSGRFWMFYGDDDFVPKGALKKIITSFTDNNSFPAFMFKYASDDDIYCKDLKGNGSLSIEQLAEKYFYYVGNAGIFAVNTSHAKSIVKNYPDQLQSTCWPQTLILFLAMYISENKQIKYMDIVSAITPVEGIVISNSYYLFETTIFALLRTAISIENITKRKDFVSIALHSVHGIQHFDVLKPVMLERYSFFDNDKQKTDFKNAVRKANTEIPKEYSREINDLYKQINLPLIFIKAKIYRNYFRNISFSNLKTSFINKLKILSPLGFMAIINQKKEALKTNKVSLKRTEVDNSSGYF